MPDFHSNMDTACCVPLVVRGKSIDLSRAVQQCIVNLYHADKISLY